jgi:UDP-N-acetylmuramyl tripeptide synthase
MRFYLALYSAKLINFLSKLFNIGSGHTWPGHFALQLCPDILNNSKMKFKSGVVLISGTNGKTTTSKILTHILENNNFKVVHNKTGANLVNGIVSEILLSMNLVGIHNADIGVFEVDENNLPILLNYVDPNVLVLLNLSRDQLDRYAEIDLILDKWHKSIDNLSSDTEIVLDATQNYFHEIPQHFKGEITYFDSDSSLLKLTNLVGTFNAKNINAAIFTAELLGVSEEDSKKYLGDFNYAYGRGEVIAFNGASYKVMLAKNPASFENNLDSILSGEVFGDAVLFILNDNIPDGRDVSWIYDINPALLNKACTGKELFICGTRSYDMAVRLHYSGLSVSDSNIFTDIKTVLNEIQHKGINNIIALPNYSAMLELRKQLTGRSIL